MLENNPELVETIRKLKRQGTPSADILRFLADHDLMAVEMMSHFREAFGLEFGDVNCIGGWFPDGSGELDDDAVSRLLDRAIAERAVDGERP